MREGGDSLDDPAFGQNRKGLCRVAAFDDLQAQPVPAHADENAAIAIPRLRGDMFSALFMLWLSRIAAVGLASRSAFSRHLTYKAW